MIPPRFVKNHITNVLASILLLVPASFVPSGFSLTFAQEEKAAERAATQRARQEASPSPSPSPEASRTTDEKKPEDEKKPADPMSPPTFKGLRLRLIGPAFTSGRVIGFAVDPNNPARYFVAAASGGVWKTINSGNTWIPVFDNEGSYSIGAITLDPKNPLTV